MYHRSPCLLYTSPSKEVVKAADKLGEGELTGVVESDTACYVAKVTSLNDEAATETKKQSLLTEKPVSYTHLDVYKRQSCNTL